MTTDVSVFGLRGQTGGPAAPTGNPLVSGPVETTTPFTGLRLIEDCAQLQAAMENRDWLSGTLAGVAFVADAAAMVTNPIGELAAMGVGWLIEHLHPLNSWFNELTGDAGAVAGAAATWTNIAGQLESVAAQYSAAVTSTIGPTASLTSSAYQRLAADITGHLGAVGTLARAVSSGLTVASTIVQVVHDLVREAIGDVVALAVGNLIPTPKLLWDIWVKVLKWVGILGDKITAVIRSISNLSGLLRQIDDLMGRLKSAFSNIRTAVPPGLPNPFRRRSDDVNDLIKKPVTSLSPAEIAKVRAARDAITAPPGTPMQRVINPSDAQDLLNGTSRYPANSTSGFTARQADVTTLHTPHDLYDGLALNYSGTPFLRADGTVVPDMHVVRYEQGVTAPEVPRHSMFGGSGRWDADAIDPTNPFTGNGYTAGGIPEFHTGGPITLPFGSQIWRTDASGVPTLIAVLRDVGGTPTWLSP